MAVAVLGTFLLAGCLGGPPVVQVGIYAQLDPFLQPVEISVQDDGETILEFTLQPDHRAQGTEWFVVSPGSHVAVRAAHEGDPSSEVQVRFAPTAVYPRLHAVGISENGDALEIVCVAPDNHPCPPW